MMERGCVDIPERGVNAFVFSTSDQIPSCRGGNSLNYTLLG